MKLTLLAAFVFALTTDALAQGVSHFCPTGALGARISATGSARIGVNGGAGDLVLHASNVPLGATGAFLASTSFTGPIPFGNGFRCIGGPIVRLPVVTDATFAIDYHSPAFTGLVSPGSQLNFQFWFRSGTTFDTSDGIQVTFGPAEIVTDVVTIAKGSHSSHPLAWSGGTLVVEDQPTWDATWSAHVGGTFPPPVAPVVDFDSYLVFVAFTGTIFHGGVAIDVRSVGASVTTLEVRTQATFPGPNCSVTTALTQPFVMVRVPKLGSTTTVDWSAASVVVDCP